MEYLNQRLYDALESHFDDVKVTKRGEVVGPGHRGEHYDVNCPYCGDQRQRLSFSYLWSGLNADNPYEYIHLVHCFNEQCVNNGNTQRDLVVKLLSRLPFVKKTATKQTGPQAVPKKPKSTDPAEPTITLPADCIPVDELAEVHPAVKYLISRNFDVHELAERWHVSYCETDPYSQPQVFKRIVIPIYRRKLLVPKDDPQPYQESLAGWIARQLPGALDDRKYMISKGMKMSHVLYGMVKALQSRDTDFVVVCEGPTDVWRVPFPAVALVGKSMSETQKNLLLQNFPDRKIFVMLDPDAESDAEKIHARLRSARQEEQNPHPVYLVKLPENKEDPADCTPDELLQALEDAERST